MDKGSQFQIQYAIGALQHSKIAPCVSARSANGHMAKLHNQRCLFQLLNCISLQNRLLRLTAL